MVSCDFHRVIEISDKIDVRPLETLKKWNVFRDQCIAIKQVCHEYQLTDTCYSFDKSTIVKAQSSCIIYFF